MKRTRRLILDVDIVFWQYWHLGVRIDEEGEDRGTDEALL